MPRNLYQRNGIFYARLQVAGAERRVSLKTADRREAERRLKVFLAETSPYHGTIRKACDDVVAEYLTEAASRVKPKTLKRYDVSALQLAEKFSGLWWEQVTRRSVVDFIDERKAAGAKIPTIRRDLTVLSQAAEYAVERGYGAANPVAEIGKRQLRYKTPTFKRPNDRSINATIDAAYANLKPLATFLLTTGMRLDEAATLRWDDVDIARKVATPTDTKSGKARGVALNEAALAVLNGLESTNGSSATPSGCSPRARVRPSRGRTSRRRPTGRKRRPAHKKRHRRSGGATRRSGCTTFGISTRLIILRTAATCMRSSSS